MASEKKLSNNLMLNISAKVDNQVMASSNSKSQDISDVTFEVDGQIFHAHRSVLAARSPVFKAQLIEPMVESNKECIKIQDMNSQVFRLLLRYIYTDFVEAADTILTQQLLKAADRYALDALRIICEERLCKNLTLDTVLSTMALADQLNCNELLDACLDFAATLEILVQLTVKQEYLNTMTNYPHVLSKLRKRVTDSYAYQNLISEEQRLRDGSTWSQWNELPLWISSFGEDQDVPIDFALY